MGKHSNKILRNFPKYRSGSTAESVILKNLSPSASRAIRQVEFRTLIATLEVLQQQIKFEDEDFKMLAKGCNRLFSSATSSPDWKVLASEIKRLEKLKPQLDAMRRMCQLIIKPEQLLIGNELVLLDQFVRLNGAIKNFDEELREFFSTEAFSVVKSKVKRKSSANETYNLGHQIFSWCKKRVDGSCTIQVPWDDKFRSVSRSTSTLTAPKLATMIYASFGSTLNEGTLLKAKKRADKKLMKIFDVKISK